VLLPLTLRGELLAVFVARGATLRAPKTLLPHLSRQAEMVCEKLLLYKASKTDPGSGLMHDVHFFELVARELDAVSESMRPATEPARDEKLHGRRPSLGVIVLEAHGLDRLARKYGHVFVEQVLSDLAGASKIACPELTAAARLGRSTFALLLQGSTAATCRKAAKAIQEEAQRRFVLHELTEQRVAAGFSLGYACFPKDMTGPELENSPGEQARVLAAKARQAAKAAAEFSADGVFGYGQILERGGVVRRALPLGRLFVSLGRDVGAREGQRFLVWSAEAGPDLSALAATPDPASGAACPPGYKGEVVLLEADEESSLAEITHRNDPAATFGPGDRLTLVADHVLAKRPGCSPESAAPRKDPGTGLYSYPDFLVKHAAAHRGEDAFTLALLRLTPIFPEDAQASPDDIAARAAGLCAEFFGPEVFGGRFSLTSLIFHHPGLKASKAAEFYTGLCRRLVLELGVEVAVGLAPHPYLHYRKDAALENVRKALDYAVLLPHPHVGVFDSLAQTIHADRLFSQGDQYGAMEEYKAALLADETNTLARNSLGVCLARLGRRQEAKVCFETVLAAAPDDVMALYNLGHVCQRLGELDEAARAFRRHLKLEPGNLYSLIRLGQIAEAEEHYGQARKHFNQAAALEGGWGPTRRHLARLALKQDRLDEAREHLHKALLHDPQDAQCLNMLARLYLDLGEDPEIAEVLARQSVALKPDQKSYWEDLARAFATRGRDNDARESLAKAASL